MKNKTSQSFQGTAHKFGDNVDTDAIIPGTCLIYNTAEELSKFTFSGVRPEFATQTRPGDIVVGGSNFGCGSSREHAPLALIGSGVSCVIAKSYARIFFRNSINIGLPLVECEDADRISEGDILEVNLGAGTVKNMTKNEEYKAVPIPDFLMEIVNAGGLISHTRQELFE
ncbi:3-isopropylmalate dehydratase small subunit [Methanolapillus ohkumae]|uniref:3-isopropylmalate dehydratase small subunit n=1 Tax=Methanolapillus ohkumae TaxID=3028298 RepID=A0AA96V9F1_9EURY|nr:3-isopropylmalate dehydratase small subunit [Methanosarcinaceae archaeon Am2]